ncbi:ATP-binding protein [Candidatus Chlorohelix sp.]|uniref:ATP-binding protein n=1 Tax=Candidatus Chlorohelix sp. TaxID=3139201 RepID=UPI0030596B63
MNTKYNPLEHQLIIYARELKVVYEEERLKRNELERANDRLRQLDEMKSTFVEIVSHELHTPITIISGYLQVLSEMLADKLQPQEAEYFNLANQQVQHLSLLVEDITNFTYLTRSEPLLHLSDPELTNNLSMVVKKELEKQQSSINEKGLSVYLNVPEQITPSNIEPARFRVIVGHLLSNAIKFNEVNGWIKINLHLTNGEETDNLVLEIANSGVFIPPEKMAQIYAPFQQIGSRNYSGLGMGLALVQHTVASFKGEIAVSSSEAEGNFFKVTLPYITWQDPVLLKQRLEHVQSLNLSYARDLRRLYEEERKKNEILAKLKEELEEKQHRLNLFLSKLLTAQEEERKKISRDLHDGLAQTLTFGHQMVEMIEVEVEDTSTSPAYKRARETLGSARTEVRRIIAGLRPDTLDRFGLIPALREYFNAMCRKYDWIGNFDVIGKFGEPGKSTISPQIAENFFRIGQEALTNVCKHSEANQVLVRLARNSGSVTLTVQDWGKGFEVHNWQNRHHLDAASDSSDNGVVNMEHIGLVSMEERMRLLGGTMTITSKPGAGTTIVANVPINE